MSAPFELRGRTAVVTGGGGGLGSHIARARAAAGACVAVLQRSAASFVTGAVIPVDGGFGADRGI
jgi:NAD(P)-dependent dehydrogenase (short-subunit alcohol dehydrogenase family)